jgi:hypothetical protein
MAHHRSCAKPIVSTLGVEFATLFWANTTVELISANVCASNAYRASGEGISQRLLITITD